MQPVAEATAGRHPPSPATSGTALQDHDAGLRRGQVRREDRSLSLPCAVAPSGISERGSLHNPETQCSNASCGLASRLSPHERRNHVGPAACGGKCLSPRTGIRHINRGQGKAEPGGRRSTRASHRGFTYSPEPGGPTGVDSRSGEDNCGCPVRQASHVSRPQRLSGRRRHEACAS
jgi:hypothetical protein